ncbi:MAG: gliding motility-associated C-terminal domain-containing protein, partial [Bacteroidota bacterium]
IDVPLGSNEIGLQFQDLLLGEDSVVFRVELDESNATTPGSSGVLGPLPLAYEGAVKSTSPETPGGLNTAPLEVEIKSTQTILCVGSSLILEARTSVPTDRITYQWSTGDTSAVIMIENPGTYVVDITAGCETASDTLDVAAQEIVAQVNLGPDRTIFQGETVELNVTTSAQAPYSLLWINSGGVPMSCSNCSNPASRPLETTRYTLILEDANGCVIEDSIVIRVDANRAVSIPNVFTPNQDGVNDVFYVSGKSLGTVTEVQIWDRFGRQVFQNSGGALNDPSRGWNGQMIGKPVATGVYFYAIKLTFPDNESRNYEGTVTLLR